MNSEKLIEINTQIAKMHMIFGIVFFAICALVFPTDIWRIDYSFRIIPRAVIIVIVLIDYALARQKYMFQFRIIQWIRMPMAMCALANIIISPYQVYEAFLSLIFFIIVMIQILYLTNISRLRYKLVFFYMAITPAVFLSIFRMILVRNIEFTIKMAIFVLIIVVYMTLSIILASQVFVENTLEIRKLKGEIRKIRQSMNMGKGTQVKVRDYTYERLSHENSEMLIENLIQQYIASSLEITNLMKLIVESLSEALVVNVCSIIVKNECDEGYQFNTRTMCNSVKVEKFNSYIQNRKIIEKFKELKDPFVDNQVSSNTYEFLNDTSIKSLLIYPLVNEGNWFGMLVIGKDTSNYFVDNMAFFERVTMQFSIALKNARTYTKMKDMAMKDGLTGIYNRTYMIQKINEYISEVVLNKAPLAVILFDIDEFKQVNDTYGHLFGDEVIRVCANVAREVAKECNGFAVRYGGEEFVIVCKDESVQELYELAQMLHEKIKQTQVVYRGSALVADISIGVAAFPTTCDNPAELIDRADKAMYHSKIGGRGRITFDRDYIAK